jgi:hypothetical protein
MGLTCPYVFALFLFFKIPTKMCNVPVLDEYYLGICALVTVGQQVWPNMHTPVKSIHLTRQNTAVCDPYKQKENVCVLCVIFLHQFTVCISSFMFLLSTVIVFRHSCLLPV